MFTGLVEATGSVEAIHAVASGRHLRVATELGAALTNGDSIAVNGVCLTVTAADPGGFEALISAETLRVTTFGTARAGQRLNLERPLRADGRVGGHFVLGHVDAVGSIERLEPQGEAWWLEVVVPRDVAAMSVPKGSITIDGISLTVATLKEDRIGVQIVPFTFAHTALSAAHAGDGVNLEADVIGKYVARLLDARAGAATAARGQE
jgi:riboflavin synthase